MARLYSLFFLFILSISGWAQQAVFQGRVELNRDLASFASQPPVPGTLYLLAGSATAIRILSEQPFVAEVEFAQGEWVDEASLVAHKVTLRFEGDAWAQRVVPKKPKKQAEQVVYPYRKFQVAAVPAAGGFRVLAIPTFF